MTSFAGTLGMTKIAGRYEITAKIGEGGMGVVYRAYDPHPMDREVAVKTLHHFADPLALDLFYKECSALKSISHPNIVEIFDMGVYEDEGHSRPFFVMPLLPGQTLDELIRKASHRLTAERVVEILAQTCRGLQAAHDRGLIHRDLKPSNVFVMTDDSVKLIDFGVAHAVHARSRSAGSDKGTLLYMAPEQLQHKPVSVQSDIYSLGVTAYEALTRRQPFRGAAEDAVIQAILSLIPPPASELNPAVNHLVSRVVHKAMAKQPWNRFDTAREFGDTLQKASRNEAIAIFDPTRLQPRIQTAARALEKGDYQFAGEIVTELEAEGHIDAQISLLRTEIDQIGRQKTIAQLLESARARFEEEEDPLALQKLHEVLQLDPGNVTALALKGKIEDRRSDRQIEKWVQLARQHVANHSYGHARDALQNALLLRPRDTRATRLLKEIEGEEREYVRLRQEKTQMYQAAVNAWKNGEVSQALSQMKRVLELDRQAPDSTSPDAAGVYRTFYDKIRSEHDALNSGYAQARRHLAAREFEAALRICRDYLDRYPGQPLFQALQFDVEEQQRQQLSAFIAEVDRRLEAERDLETKVNLLCDAATEYPDEEHFARLLKLFEDKRDLVNSIVERSRIHEERGQLSEALSDLDTLQTIYDVYPGLRFEKERLQRRLEQQTREAARARWVAQVDQQLAADNWASAIAVVDKALGEYQGDAELLAMRRLAEQGIERAARAEQLSREGHELCEQGQFEDGVDRLRSALQLDDRPTTRLTLRDVFVARAQAELERDWQSAQAYADRALEFDPGHTLARSLRAQALDRGRQELVDQCASRARTLQAAGDLDAALAEIATGLANCPGEPRLTAIRDALAKDLARSRGRSAGPEPAVAPAANAQPSAHSNADDLERTWLVASRAAAEMPTMIRPLGRARAFDADAAAADVTAVITADGDADAVASSVDAPASRPAQQPVPTDAALAARAPAGRSRTALALVAGGAAAIILLVLVLWRTASQTAPTEAVAAGTAPVTAPAAPPAAPRAPVGTTVANVRIVGTVGAQIAVDGRMVGTSPLQIELGEGEHAIQASLGGVSLRRTITVAPAEREGYSRVRVSGNGVATVRDVEVAGGEELPVTLSLTPAQALLVLDRVPPGARVSLDNVPLGVAGPDGRFTSSAVPAGTHTIQLVAPDYEPVTVTRDFAAGTPVTLTAADLGLRAAAVTVEFLADADTTIRILQNGQPLHRFTGPSTVSLPSGTLEVRAEGPAGIPITQALSVGAGGPRSVDVRNVPSGIERFGAAAFTLRDSWYTRRGGNFVLYNRTAPQHAITFTVRRNRGRLFSSGQRLRWVVGYVDERNYVRFELDDERFYRVEVTNGQMRTTETRHRMPEAEQVHISIQAAGVRLLHQYSLPGGGWTTLDNWARSTPFEGRFGFYLPGDEELQVMNFQYRPGAP